MCLISICIAASERDHLLTSRCLPSIFQQTVQNFEIVIVGDCVESETAMRIGRISDKRISFRNLYERGPYPRPGMNRWRVAGTNAMNMAMDVAKGDFICHIDDDDEMLPDKLERCLVQLDKGDVDFLWHPFYCQDTNGQWAILGDGTFKEGQITTGAVFYKRALTKIRWDVFAYTREYPGDWDRFLRMKQELNPKMKFLDCPLLWHHRENNHGEFVPKTGERFLEG